MAEEPVAAAHKILQRFPTLAKSMPDKRAVLERKGDFAEIYGEFEAGPATDQAGRCSQCGVPFCQVHCPLHNNIPDWLKMTAEGRLEEAYELSQATNSFPEICGRICPQDRLCEGNCVIEKGFESVSIGAIEKYITDTAWERGWVKPPQPDPLRAYLAERSVGIIGAGPGGLAAADALCRRGFQVHVYDRHDRAGGLMIYGIPNFKLEKSVVARRVQQLVDGGVTFHLNFEVGRDSSLKMLRSRHDAILIATGVYRPRDLEISGMDGQGMVSALDYLITANRQGLGDPVPEFASGERNARGKDVVVIGGGDTAMDCVRTAVRQGARAVTCLYRRDRANMPGSLREVANAEEEGVRFQWLAAPEALVLTDGRVSALRASRIHLGLADATGRQAPQIIPDSHFTQAATLVIPALGFDPEDLPTLFGSADLTVTRWGTVRVNPETMMTSIDGVFAAGDIVRGASLVVWAIHDGRMAAAAIDAYIHKRLYAQAAE